MIWIKRSQYSLNDFPNFLQQTGLYLFCSLNNAQSKAEKML
jgi:hypothetical protein